MIENFSGINVFTLKQHKKSFWNFKNFIIFLEGFNSLRAYDNWLLSMDFEEKNNTRWYYVQKYIAVLKVLEIIY